MAWASDGPASSADLGWRSKDLTEYTWTHNVGYWSGEGFRANGTRTRVVRTLSTALIRFVRKVKVCWLVSLGIPSGHNWNGATENLGSYSKKKLHVGKTTRKGNKALNPFVVNSTPVEMRHTCQVTNQSSHGELSFHHNPHLRLCWGLRLSTSRVIRRGGARLKNAAHPTYCHCCELCAIKQKPGVLLEKNYF